MTVTNLLLGAMTGSALMFVLDPDRGARRRALLRDQLTRAGRKTRDGLDATARDMANRTGGVMAAARQHWSAEQPSDAKLEKRVRARLGRVSSHPRAIAVAVNEGEVILRGIVLASEHDSVLAEAAAVAGVGAVLDLLEAHESADGIPSLQGEGRMAGPSWDLPQANWTPATRAVVGAGLLAAGALLAIRAGRA
jgi:hypothetical protein